MRVATGVPSLLRLLTAIVFLLAAKAAVAGETCSKVFYRGDAYTVCRFDPAVSNIRLYENGPSGKPYGSFQALEDDLAPGGVYAPLCDERRHVRGGSVAGWPLRRGRAPAEGTQHPWRLGQFPPPAERRLLYRGGARRRHGKQGIRGVPHQAFLCHAVGTDARHRRQAASIVSRRQHQPESRATASV